MSDGFVLGDGAAGPLPGAWVAGNGTAGAAVGTKRGGSECLGLLFEEVGERSFGESCGGSVRELLHGVKIGVESGSVVAESSSSNNFAPVGGKVVDFLEQFRGKLAGWHDRYYLVLATRERVEFLSPLYDTQLHLAKLLMASGECVRTSLSCTLGPNC